MSVTGRMATQASELGSVTCTYLNRETRNWGEKASGSSHFHLSPDQMDSVERTSLSSFANNTPWPPVEGSPELWSMSLCVRADGLEEVKPKTRLISGYSMGWRWGSSPHGSHPQAPTGTSTPAIGHQLHRDSTSANPSSRGLLTTN